MRSRTLIPIVCAAAAALFAVETVKTPINNDDVRVLDVVLQPHEKTSMHEHTVNRVMIYRNAGSQKFEYADGRHTVLSFRENEVKWSPVEGKHIAEVSTEKPVNLIEIEAKKAAAGKKVTSAIDPVKIDPQHYKVEFENSQVRVLHAKIEPHGVALLHEHSLNRVTVFLTDQEFRVTDSQGKVDIVKHKAGEAIWGTPITHTEENLSDQPFEVVAVELKN